MQGPAHPVRARSMGGGMGRFSVTVGLVLVLSLGAPALADGTPEGGLPPAGAYHLDPQHARLLVSVNHLGFSEYITLFKTFTADLGFDPASPEKMSLSVSIDPTSIETFYGDPKLDFNAVIAGESFLDAAKYPAITFKSTAIRQTGPDAAAVTGDLTLHGVTKPVTLRVHYNGGYAGNPLDPAGARIGFSAEGAIFRSDFGMALGLPPAGSTMGIGDLVAIRIEVEFTNPNVSGVQVGP